MQTAPPEEERFQANVLRATGLVKELISNCYDKGYKQINPMMIGLASAYLSGLDKNYLIDTFINHTKQVVKKTDTAESEYEPECWRMIRTRNEKFFVEHSDKIFGQLPVEKGNIDAFKILFTSKNEKGEYIVEQPDRDAVFDIFVSMVKICLKYIHRRREPFLAEIDGKMKPQYKYNFCPEVKVMQISKLWKVELPMPKP